MFALKIQNICSTKVIFSLQTPTIKNKSFFLSFDIYFLPINPFIIQFKIDFSFYSNKKFSLKKFCKIIGKYRKCRSLRTLFKFIPIKTLKIVFILFFNIYIFDTLPEMGLINFCYLIIIKS